jgi:hypothetical protein
MSRSSYKDTIELSVGAIIVGGKNNGLDTIT